MGLTLPETAPTAASAFQQPTATPGPTQQEPSPSAAAATAVKSEVMADVDDLGDVDVDDELMVGDPQTAKVWWGTWRGLHACTGVGGLVDLGGFGCMVVVITTHTHKHMVEYVHMHICTNTYIYTKTQTHTLCMVHACAQPNTPPSTPKYTTPNTPRKIHHPPTGTGNTCSRTGSNDTPTQRP